MVQTYLLRNLVAIQLATLGLVNVFWADDEPLSVLTTTCEDKGYSAPVPASVAELLIKDLPALTYLANVDIQGELKIDDGQQAALNLQVAAFFHEWDPLWDEERRLLAAGTKQNDKQLKEIQAKRLDIMARTSKKSLSLLTGPQIARFHQLLFQFRGIEFLLQPAVQVAAGIDADEIIAIQETRRWVVQQGTNIQREIEGKKAGEQELTKRIVRLRQSGWARLEPKLSPESRQIVAAWRGKAASFEEHKLNLEIRRPNTRKP